MPDMFIHNIFLDHINHEPGEYHHHHSPEGGILYHKHHHGVAVNDDGHGHRLRRYYDNNLVGSEHFASNNHTHDPIAPDYEE